MGKAKASERAKVTKSINVSPEVWQALRLRSVKEGKHTSDIVQGLIVEFLKEKKAKK